jgi:hypothetical protein
LEKPANGRGGSPSRRKITRSRGEIGKAVDRTGRPADFNRVDPVVRAESERCLLREFELRGIPAINQEQVVHWAYCSISMSSRSLMECQGLSSPEQTRLEQKDSERR